MKLLFSAPPALKPAKTKPMHALVVGVLEGGKLSATAANADKATGGALSAALSAGRFKGKKGQCVSVILAGKLEWDRIVLAGLGKEADFSERAAEDIGGSVVAHLNQSGVKSATFVVESGKAKLGAAHIGLGALMRAWRFDKYRTTEKEDEKPTLQQFTVAVQETKKAQAAFAPLQKILDGVLLTRELVSEPANVIHPESLAARCLELKKLGLQIEVLGEKEMAKLGMHALLGVGQGSARESKTVIMRWNGNAKDKKGPLAFIGKGVCFDTGGISIKPAAGMEEMKWDMGGAGTVIGLMAALAGRKAKVNAVGAIGLVENMPDGNAQRPGDVVTSMSGQTIEVINTDAEGRLVLSDVLWYTQKRFKPRFMIDLATLTGAIIVALGHERAGLFSNDNKLAAQIEAAGKRMNEPVWRFPLGGEYDRQINSDIADMKNVGEGRSAGSITAAQFLQRFVNKTPWAHLDIAGTAWCYKDTPTCAKGAAGFGVRLLNALVEEYYE